MNIEADTEAKKSKIHVFEKKSLGHWYDYQVPTLREHHLSAVMR